MNRKKLLSKDKYILWIIILSLSGAIYAFIYGRIEKYKIKNLPVKYAYEPNWKKSPVLFIRNLRFKNNYIKYVAESLKNSNKISIDFPYKVLPPGEIIYINKYLVNSTFVDFYSPEYHGKIYGYTTGFIHRAFIFDSLKTQ